jgi:hypothetical protein
MLREQNNIKLFYFKKKYNIRKSLIHPDKISEGKILNSQANFGRFTLNFNLTQFKTNKRLNNWPLVTGHWRR